jgi:hypothetical protein
MFDRVVAEAAAPPSRAATRGFAARPCAKDDAILALEARCLEWEARAAQIIRDKDAHLEQVAAAKDELIRGLEAGCREWEAYAGAIARDKDAHLTAVVGERDERIRQLDAEVDKLAAWARGLENGLAYYQGDRLVQGYVALKRLLRKLPLA